MCSFGISLISSDLGGVGDGLGDTLDEGWPLDCRFGEECVSVSIWMRSMIWVGFSLRFLCRRRRLWRITWNMQVMNTEQNNCHVFIKRVLILAIQRSRYLKICQFDWSASVRTNQKGLSPSLMLYSVYNILYILTVLTKYLILKK